MQSENKFLKINLVLLKWGKFVDKHAFPTHQEMDANNENLLVRLLL